MLPAAPAMAQNGGLPTREQIDVPQAPAAAPRAGIDIRDDRALASCPFTESGLSAAIDRVEWTDQRGNPLPPTIAELLAPVAPSGSAEALTQICELRDTAARRLTAADFIAAVTIPPQEIDHGARSVRLTVILAQLVDVTVIGDPGPLAGRIDALSARLRKRYPLRRADIERELLLMSDSPGLKVQLNLAATGTPGEVVGQLRVARLPFALSAQVQNYGSRAIGRETGTLRAEFYGLTGMADTTFIGFSATPDLDEQVTVQGGHYFALPGGATFGGSIAYSEAHPDLGTLDLRSRSVLGAIEGYAVLSRTVTGRATAGGGLEFVDQESNLHGGGRSYPVTRDRLRVLFARVQFAQRRLLPTGAEAWSLDGTLEVRKGLGILGATERGVAVGGYFPSRIQGDPEALLIRGGYSARLSSGAVSLLTQVQGQYSGRPLLAFDEYSVGNYTIGRGYDPAVTSGDSALAVRIQPSFVVRTGRASLVEPYGFVDAARIWNKDALTTENGRSLVSAGLGARLYVSNRFRLDASWAHPFDRGLNLPGARRAPDRFLLSVSTSFGPAPR